MGNYVAVSIFITILNRLDLKNAGSKNNRSIKNRFSFDELP